VSALEHDTFSGPSAAKCPIDVFGPVLNLVSPSELPKAQGKIRTF
jgi:hypothetical protein